MEFELGEIDVCSKDSKLLEIYQQQYGPENETIYEFYKRSYNNILNRIIEPKKSVYSSSQLENLATSNGYEIREFNFASSRISLHGCHWIPPSKDPSPSNINESQDTGGFLTCIVYCHTNMGSLMDSHEVLPLAKKLNDAHVLSFDFPGCGKSEGKLSADIEKDVETFLLYTRNLLGNTVRIILWSRGMATAPTINLLSTLSRLNHLSTETLLISFNIVSVVLDSPFISIQGIIESYLEKVQGKGFSVSKSIARFFVNRSLSGISRRLNGFNLSSVRPVDNVSKIKYPVIVLSALEDDYIPAMHGEEIARCWGDGIRNVRRCPAFVQYYQFHGGHFGKRNEDIITLPLDLLGNYFDVVGNASAESNINFAEGTFPSSSKLDDILF